MRRYFIHCESNMMQLSLLPFFGVTWKKGKKSVIILSGKEMNRYFLAINSTDLIISPPPKKVKTYFRLGLQYNATFAYSFFGGYLKIEKKSVIIFQA